MKPCPIALFGLAAVLLTASSTSAQSTGPSPGLGSGTGTTPTPAGDLDLPVEKPVAPAPTPPPAPPTPPDRPDPRDEPPPTIYGEEISSENDTISYVLDISCSMDWDRRSYTTLEGTTASGTRLDRAKVELLRSIMGLSRNFKFNVIAYDCGTQRWQREMQEASDRNKQSAAAWVRRLTPIGATATGPACALALGDRQNMSVVLLTDGAPNCGANGFDGHRRMISRANSQGATINVFGISASGVFRQFCQNVAADAGGSYFDVP
ncbi:MAG: VWA domain-containing protein [Planctomycetes bacterium]|nr:VWA domain-containing protein [Planctomycetota bacterium]